MLYKYYMIDNAGKLSLCYVCLHACLIARVHENWIVFISAFVVFAFLSQMRVHVIYVITKRNSYKENLEQSFQPKKHTRKETQNKLYNIALTTDKCETYVNEF